MNKISFKQKIFFTIIIAIILIAIGIYGFTNINKEETFQVESIEYYAENIQENEEEKLEVEEIIVHITGEVKKSGVISLKEGARIIDAIEEAGGVTEEADLDEVNLAYALEDGQKIYIPNKKDKEIKSEKQYITNESGNNVIVQNVNDGKGVSKKVNINTASQSELENLPGIGPAIANRIIEYRTQNGKFNSIEDLQNVKGIGDAKFANIKDNIIVK